MGYVCLFIYVCVCVVCLFVCVVCDVCDVCDVYVGRTALLPCGHGLVHLRYGVCMYIYVCV